MHTTKCIASRNLSKITYLKYFLTQFKSVYRQGLHNWRVHSSRYCCTTLLWMPNLKFKSRSDSKVGVVVTHSKLILLWCLKLDLLWWILFTVLLCLEMVGFDHDFVGNGEIALTCATFILLILSLTVDVVTDTITA